MRMCTRKRVFTNSFYCCFLLLIGSAAFAQNGYIKGSVNDSSGNPVANANIMLKNTMIGTATNEFGNYSLRKIKPGNYTIVFSSINFKTKTKVISINPNDTLIENFIVNTTD